jgi:hypothetical protein
MSTTAISASPVGLGGWEVLEADEVCVVEESERPSPLELLHREVREDDADVQALFDDLADELAKMTAGVSSPRKAMRHPAYAEILELGGAAVPLLLERVQEGSNRPLWLRLLGSLTGFSPGAGQETVPDAATAWLRWGRHQGRRFGGP